MKKEELEQLLIKTVKSSLENIQDNNIDLQLSLIYEEKLVPYTTGGYQVNYIPKVELSIKTGNRI